MRSDLIMVVEDDEDLRQLYVDAIKLKGFKVQAYSGTAEALFVFRKVPFLLPTFTFGLDFIAR